MSSKNDEESDYALDLDSLTISYQLRVFHILQKVGYLEEIKYHLRSIHHPSKWEYSTSKFTVKELAATRPGM
jgi:hypothetical protein